MPQETFYHIPRHMNKNRKEGDMPILTLRKLIRFGGDGVVITVPTGWVRYHKLKAGDRLEVIVNDNLVVRPNRTTGKSDVGPEDGR